MNLHDDFWLNHATSKDYADPNISTKEQVDYIVESLSAGDVNDTILDFGCGYGRLAQEIKKVFTGSIVMGMDINPDILNKAMQESSVALPIYYAKSNKIGIVGAYDAIYSVAVIQHFPDERKHEFIDNASISLNPGGRLIFQYVEGDYNAFLTHNTRIKNIRRWCLEAGLLIIDERFDFIQENWTWVVAERAV